MFKKNVVLILLLVLCYCVSAQDLLRKPKKYIEHPDGKILDKSTVDVDNDKIWIVYSDKNSNAAYHKPNTASGVKNTVGFLDAFYVTEESGDFLHIYKYDPSSKEVGRKNKFTLKKTAEDLGWIAKSNLLLWENCLETDNNLSIKALPVIKQENENRTEFISSKKAELNLFQDPELQQKSTRTCAMFQFLFVYKMDNSNNSVLLGTSYRVRESDITTNMLGWVNKDLLQLWGNRICLEPDYDLAAASKRKSLGIKSSMFKTQGDAQSWKNGNEPSDDTLWNADPYENRWEPTQKRLPILETVDKENGIVKTGRVTGIFNEKGKEVVTESDHAKIDKGANEKVIAEMKNYNIVFVVDGSNTMGSYIKSARDVVSMVANRLKPVGVEDGGQAESDKVYKYGCVFYRSEQDMRCNGVDLSLKPYDLTPRSEDILDFIDKELDVKGCDITGTNMRMIVGVETALRMFNNKNQSNIVVLIGGPSKTIDQSATDRIVQLILEKNAHLLTFQVQKPLVDNPNYRNFFQSINNIINTSGTKSANTEKSKNDKDKAKTIRFNPDSLFIRFGKNNYILNYPKQAGLMGLISFCDPGNFIPKENLAYAIDSLIKIKESNTQDAEEALVKSINGIGEKELPPMNAELLRYFNAIRENVPAKQKDMVSKYSGKNFQYFFPGFTALSCKGTEVYKRVLYVSKDELQELKNSLRKLQEDYADATTQRTQLKTAYITVLATYLGEAKAKDKIENGKITAEQALSFVTGLNSKNPSLKIRISDLTNKSAVTQSQIEAMVSVIKKKYKDLDSIDDNNDNKMIYDWGTFFWVPEDFLP